MPLSSQMSKMLLRKLHEAANQDLFTDEELIQMKPIFDHQRKHSMIPKRMNYSLNTLKTGKACTSCVIHLRGEMFMKVWREL